MRGIIGNVIIGCCGTGGGGGGGGGGGFVDGIFTPDKGFIILSGIGGGG